MLKSISFIIRNLKTNTNKIKKNNYTSLVLNLMWTNNRQGIK